MSALSITPIEAARLANSGGDANSVQRINEVLAFGTGRDIQEFIHNIDTRDHSHWYKRASAALEIRLAEDAAETANKLVQHTEKLTQQTDRLVNDTISH